VGGLLLAAPEFHRLEELALSNYGNMPPPPPPPPAGGYERGYGAGPSGAGLASWGQRVGAYLLDRLLLLPFGIVYAIALPKATTTTDLNGTPSSAFSGGSWPIVLLMGALMLAIDIYNRWYKGGQGQSFGKKKLGLTLLGESTGQPVGMGRAFLRDLSHTVDGIICYVGYLFPLWDAKRQTIADKITTTVVTSKA
jgi:uncharacterized RDD family membrane protein YckC